MIIKQIPSTYKLPILSHDWSGTSENCEHCKRENAKDRLFGLLDELNDVMRETAHKAEQATQAFCTHQDWDLQMDNSGRTWSVCNTCGLEGD